MSNNDLESKYLPFVYLPVWKFEMLVKWAENEMK